LELLVVVALLIAIIVAGLFVSMDVYRLAGVRSQRDEAVSVLEEARVRAMTNTDESPWGACPQGGGWTLVVGGSCPGGAVFTQLSGTATPVAIPIMQDGRTATITVNYEGAILW